MTGCAASVIGGRLRLQRDRCGERALGANALPRGEEGLDGVAGGDRGDAFAHDAGKHRAGCELRRLLVVEHDLPHAVELGLQAGEAEIDAVVPLVEADLQLGREGAEPW